MQSMAVPAAALACPVAAVETAHPIRSDRSWMLSSQGSVGILLHTDSSCGINAAAPKDYSNEADWWSEVVASRRCRLSTATLLQKIVPHKHRSCKLSTHIVIKSSNFSPPRQGARSRTRLIIGVRHRKVVKKTVFTALESEGGLLSSNEGSEMRAVDPGTWGRIRTMTLGNNIVGTVRARQVDGKSASHWGSMHAL